MRNRIILSLALALMGLGAQAQTSTTSSAENTQTSTDSKPSRDFFMLQFNYEGWLNAPDSLNVSGFGRGINAYICYDFPLGKSNFSFALGLGVGTSNIYFKDRQISFTDTGALGDQVTWSPETTRDYSRYKLTTAYIDAPLELRFFGNKTNRNKGFKAAIGIRPGIQVDAHSKGNFSVAGTKMNEKINARRYFDSWRIGPTLRIGYGNITLMGTYNLSTLFKEDLGPAVTPFSLGICLTGL